MGYVFLECDVRAERESAVCITLMVPRQAVAFAGHDLHQYWYALVESGKVYVVAHANS